MKTPSLNWAHGWKKPATMAKPCAVSGVVTITPSLVIINSYRTKGYVTNHCTIGFTQGTQMNLANIVTIEACCYSDTSH